MGRSFRFMLPKATHHKTNSIQDRTRIQEKPMKKETKTLLKRVSLLVVLEGLLGLVFFPAFMVALFTGTRFYPVLTLILSVTLALSFFFFIFGIKFRKHALPFYVFLVLLVPSAIGIRTLYHYLDGKVPVVSDGADITRYQPFSGEVAKLPVEPRLQLTDSLPVLDGALALYPVYAAFATAVYPEGEYPLQTVHRRGGPQPRYAGEPTGLDPETHAVHFTNTVDGFEGLLDGRVDIFFMAELSEAQREMAGKKGIDLVFTPIGKEAFVFFVNRENPVNDLTVENLRSIYSGKTTHWKQLGGKGRIKAFQRNRNSGSQSALEHFMAGEKRMSPPMRERSAGMDGIIKEVAGYRNYKGALGFSFRFFATRMTQNSGIKLLKINGIAPTEENVRNGSYPLISTLYAITRKNHSNPNVRRMLDWMVSDQGQYLVQETGYTPIREIKLP